KPPPAPGPAPQACVPPPCGVRMPEFPEFAAVAWGLPGPRPGPLTAGPLRPFTPGPLTPGPLTLGPLTLGPLRLRNADAGFEALLPSPISAFPRAIPGAPGPGFSVVFAGPVPALAVPL